MENALPFQHLTNEIFYFYQKGVPHDDNINSSIQLIPTHRINTLFKKINDFNDPNSDVE